MYIGEIKVGQDYIESCIDGARLEGLNRSSDEYSSNQDLSELENVFSNIGVVKVEGRIVYGLLEEENSNEIPISIEATGEILSPSSRKNLVINTKTLLDSNRESKEVITLNDNTIIIPEPDDDGDDDYGIFYIIGRTN